MKSKLLFGLLLASNLAFAGPIKYTNIIWHNNIVPTKKQCFTIQFVNNIAVRVDRPKMCRYPYYISAASFNDVCFIVEHVDSSVVIECADRDGNHPEKMALTCKRKNCLGNGSWSSSNGIKGSFTGSNTPYGFKE